MKKQCVFVFVMILICGSGGDSAFASVIDNGDTLYVPAGETYTLDGAHTYEQSVTIEGTLYVSYYNGTDPTGTIELHAPQITITGSIDANGRGFRSDEGPGVGADAGGGSGAGYGGAGGRGGGYGGYGGSPYGTATSWDIAKGSGGTSSGRTSGGAGGGCIILHSHSLFISGVLTADGSPGLEHTWAGGGGSGGGIRIDASNVLISGWLFVDGGAGGDSASFGGGGGAGGRIKIFCDSLDSTGSSITYNGGPGGGGTFGGGSGQYGTYYVGFVPEPATITLAPDGGETLLAGTTYMISWWSYGSISNVLIEYSTNNGTDWSDVNTVPNTGSYNWLVPAVSSSQCLVRVSDSSNPSISDTSDGVFTIRLGTIYVDDDAPDDPEPNNPDISDPCEDGSLGHPLDAIQEAIDAAYDGDTVIVLDGIYTGTGNRDVDYGGRAITVRSTNPNDSSLVAATIIDCNGTEADPHRGFYFHNGERGNSSLDGFTITNGYGPEEQLNQGQWRSVGGGIYCEYTTSPTITNCTFSGNSAEWWGGGMSISMASGPTVMNCIFTGNSAGDKGGGIYCARSVPSIINCIIRNNDANDGGGVYFGPRPPWEPCEPDPNGPIIPKQRPWPIPDPRIIATVQNCVIAENSAKMGGGMYNLQSSPTLTNCTFSGNSAGHLGGGMYNLVSSPTVTGCTFSGNWAGWGGGMYNFGSSPIVTNCTISGNSADQIGGGVYCNSNALPIISNCIIRNNDANDGGGVYFWGGPWGPGPEPDPWEPDPDGPTILPDPKPWPTPPPWIIATVKNCIIAENSANEGGGVSCSYSSNVLIANNLIVGNIADYGGGIKCIGAKTEIVNNTVTNNVADIGGGIYCIGSGSTNITNCIFWGNIAQDGPEIALASLEVSEPTPWPGEDPGDTSFVPSTATISFSDVQGEVAVVYSEPNCILNWGEGNIDADPCFVDVDSNDFHLLPDSPCIDTGDPNYVLDPNFPTDLDGNPRVIGGRIDMGAYESNYQSDLVVTSEDINFVPIPGEPCSPVTISATMHNAGIAPAENFEVQFKDFEEIIGNVIIPSIAAGESNTVSIQHTWDEASFRLITVTADPYDNIQETDEENNSGSKVYQIGQPADMNAAIVVSCSAPTGFPADSTATVNGQAIYDIIVAGQPNYEYPVKGGSVSVQVFDSNGVHQLQQELFTKTDGRFNVSFPVPGQVGDRFEVVFIVTDGSLTGTLRRWFDVTEFRDLFIYSSDITFSNDNPAVGETITIGATIHADTRNTYIEPNVPVTFYAYHETLGDSQIDEPLQYTFEIAPGDNNTVSTDWTPQAEGLYYITIVLGPDFSDDRNWNNQATRTIVVGPLPMFTVTASPRYTSVGQVVQITVDSRESLPSNQLDSITVTDSLGQDIPPFPLYPGNPDHPSPTRWVYQTEPLPEWTALGTATITVIGMDSDSNTHSGEGYFVVEIEPDLWVYSEDVNFSDINPDLGETITIDAVIHANPDNFDTVLSVPVTFYAHHAGGDTYKIGQTLSIVEMPPGANWLVSTTWRNAAEGEYIIEVVLGPGFLDKNNGNNQATRELIVGNRPPVAACWNIAVEANINCQGVVVPADIDAGSFDPDGDLITLSLEPPGPYQLGQTTVMLAVSDGMESATCEATITVVDITPPMITYPANITIECGQSTDPSNTGDATATDNCDPSPTIAYSDSSVPGCGNTEVITRTWTATDVAVNSSSCVQVITVQDTTPPVFTSVPQDVNVLRDGNGNVAELDLWLASTVEAEDTCENVAITNDFTTFPYECGKTGSVTVTWTAEDECGNPNSTSATFTIEDPTTAVTYDGDMLLSTDGNSTVGANLIATLRNNDGNVLDIDGEEVTFTLTAEGVSTIVETALSENGVASAAISLEPAIYMIEVTLGCLEFTTSAILVVYNPEGGFATGAGQFVPEDDGLNTHPNVRAKFGFEARYKEDNPTGHIKFRYLDRYMDLESSSIEQLVITGGKIVQFKGWASVNGVGGNWFFVKGIDNGEPGRNNDTFEIKVWYPDISPEGDPSERAGGVLQGGNIVVKAR